MSSKPTPQDLTIHVDAEKQTVTFTQKQSQFELRPSVVVVPVIAIEALYVNLVTQALRARGVEVGQKQMNVADPNQRAAVSA